MERLEQDVPVFPLPGVVLFPGLHLPLHVFEDRYIELVHYALEQDGRIAVPMLAPGWDEEYFGRPPVHPITGLGVIEQYAQLPDGRYNLLMKGLCRAELGEEIRGSSFRIFECRQAQSVYPSPGSLDAAVATLETCCRQVLTRQGAEDSAMLARRLGRLRDPGEMADLAAASLLEDPQARQRVLEALDVGERMQLVTASVAELLLRAETVEAEQPH